MLASILIPTRCPKPWMSKVKCTLVPPGLTLLDLNSLDRASHRVSLTASQITHPSSSNPKPTLTTLLPVEQESYIKRLAATNKAQNAQTALILLALPLLAILPYLPPLLSSSSSSFPSLLAITSLASTAYLLRRLPPTVTGILPLDVWSGTGGAAGAASPLDANLPYLNALLALLLSFWGGAVAYKARNFGGDDAPQGGMRGPLAWPIMCNLPAAVYALVLAAKMAMAGVDPERELSALRYEYKGA